VALLFGSWIRTTFECYQRFLDLCGDSSLDLSLCWVWHIPFHFLSISSFPFVVDFSISFLVISYSHSLNFASLLQVFMFTLISIFFYFLSFNSCYKTNSRRIHKSNMTPIEDHIMWYPELVVFLFFIPPLLNCHHPIINCHDSATIILIILSLFCAI